MNHYGNVKGTYDSSAIVALSESLLEVKSLTSVNLGVNWIGRDETRRLITILGKKKMVTIGLSGSDLGPEGAGAISEMIRGTTSVTEVRSSFMGDDCFPISSPMFPCSTPLPTPLPESPMSRWTSPTLASAVYGAAKIVQDLCPGATPLDNTTTPGSPCFPSPFSRIPH